MIQLTEKQFEIFKEECQRWIQLLGIPRLQAGEDVNITPTEV